MQLRRISHLIAEFMLKSHILQLVESETLCHALEANLHDARHDARLLTKFKAEYLCESERLGLVAPVRSTSSLRDSTPRVQKVAKKSGGYATSSRALSAK